MAINLASCVVGTCVGAWVIAFVVVSTGFSIATVCVNQTLWHRAVGGEFTNVALA